MNSFRSNNTWFAIGALGVLWLGLFSCTKDKALEPSGDDPDTEPMTSPVVFDPAQVPYDSLSTYNFFEGLMFDHDPVYGVLPYEPITPLFTDYAHKHRFLWMPDSVGALYVSDHESLDFPDGTVLIKSFYYDRVQPNDETRIIETRLMYKLNGAWQFADYIWNADQSEATLDLNGSYVDLDFIDDNNIARNAIYRVPSEAECETCHKKNNIPSPIGTKPQNLNKDLFYSDGPMNQLQKWQEVGYLAGTFPSTIETVVDWEDINEPLEDRVRAYLDMNCSHCHSDNARCDYRVPRFAWNMSTDTTNLGICVVPDEFPLPQFTHIISRGNIARSVLHYRLNTTDETVRMPQLGRTLIHDEAVQMIEQWINTLNPPCN